MREALFLPRHTKNYSALIITFAMQTNSARRQNMIYNIHMKKVKLGTLLVSLIFFPLCALGQNEPQDMRNRLIGTTNELPNPFDFPILLSGNFGELRSNHFHSGIDFKTQGAEGKPVHVVQSGYVSRISVSPWGYGNCIYVTHPDGTTTVYAHLQRFSEKIAEFVKEQQYEKEQFSLNIFPEAGKFPVIQGEIIALSGNSGSSGGPHLHFEVRDTKTEEIIDPLPYFKDKIKDSTPPRILGVMVYPVEGRGIANGSQKKQQIKLVSQDNGGKKTASTVEAWGEIGFAIKCYDYMDGTSNIYGVRIISLDVDGTEIFRSDISRFAFSETRYLNSLTDYGLWHTSRSFYIKSFIEPGNRLRFLSAKNRGIVNINEERTYNFTYTLQDAYGNTTRLSVPVKGKKQSIPAADTTGKELMSWNKENRFGAKGIRLTIPNGNLYRDIYMKYSVREDSTLLAATHYLNDELVPLHKSARLSIRLNPKLDTLNNKRQYGIVQWKNGKASWIGGTYRNGWVNGEIRELGAFTIRQDTKAPTITPLNIESWVRKKCITLRLSDNLSGVESYRGEIDGKFALFEMNSQSVITYRFDDERLVPGKHTLTVSATDACGNKSSYSYTFYYD